jgi:hypothetical protein
MTDIVVTISGDKKIARKLRQMGVTFIDLKPTFTKVGDYLTDFYSGEVYASRGGVIGSRWAPLSSSYAADKARTFPGRPPLIRTGLMNRSYNSEPSKQSLTLYNDTPYFDFHQEGTRRMPQRKTMDVDQPRQVKIIQMISADLTKIMEQ